MISFKRGVSMNLKPTRSIVSHLSRSVAVKSNLFRKSKSCLERKDAAPETQDANRSGSLENMQDRVDEVSSEGGSQLIPYITVGICMLLVLLDFICYMKTGKHWLPDLGYVLAVVVSGCSLTFEKRGRQSKQ